MEKKYELLKDDTIEVDDHILYRIKALKDFANVKKGDLGGYIEKEGNLAQNENCWVYGNAHVYDNAHVLGNAWVYNNACISNDADIYSDFDYCAIFGFGSEARTTTFFKCKDGAIKVNYGCFNGTLDEFRKKVKETHGDNKYAKEYLMAADLVELKLS